MKGSSVGNDDRYAGHDSHGRFRSATWEHDDNDQDVFHADEGDGYDNSYNGSLLCGDRLTNADGP